VRVVLTETNSYNQVPKEQYNEPSYNSNQGAGRVAQSRVEQNIPEIDIDDEIPF
jgi:single-strand DNA-binding protein